MPEHFPSSWPQFTETSPKREIKLTQHNRKPLKKIPRMDKRFPCRTLDRGRSSFSKSQHSYPHLGSQRRTTPGSFCRYSRENRFLWSSQFKEWPTFNPGRFCFQYRNLSRFSFLSNQFHRQAYSSNFRPCQLPPSQGFKAFSTKAPGLSYPDFLAFLFSKSYNPIERVWRITRRKVTHNRYFPKIGDLREALMNQFAQWRYPNKALKVLCINI